MSPLAWIALVGLILITGALLYWWVEKRPSRPSAVAPPPRSSDMGYGAERWQREYALWSGVVRRLEIQARHYNPIPDRLHRELAEARAKVAEAVTHIEQKS